MIAQVQKAEKNKQALAETELTEGFSLMQAGGAYSFSSLQFGSNDLWLEVLSVDLTNQQTSLRLHGTVDTNNYQILFTNRVETLGNSWTLGTILPGTSGTNQTDFPNLPVGTNSQMFFRAHQANAIAYIFSYGDAFESNAVSMSQDGQFTVFAYDPNNDVTIYYRLSGTASNSVDYTNLTGTVTVPTNVGYADIYVHPLQDNLVEGIETVTVTLIQTNDYLIEPGIDSATLKIFDSPITLSVWAETPLAVEPNGPPGVGAQAGVFRLSRSDASGLYPAMDVYYHVSGTASNGVDYTFLNGLIHFQSGISDTNLDVTPLADNVLEGMEIVSITLIPTNTYLITSDTNYAAAQLSIIDSSTTVGIYSGADAVEPSPPDSIVDLTGVTGYFQIQRSDLSGFLTNLTIFYQISGTATNGVDYTNLTGTVTMLPDQTSTNIYVQPLADNLTEGTENLKLTLLANSGFYVDPSHSSATNRILDSTVTNLYFIPVVIGLNTVVGIDFHAPSNSLIVSLNYPAGQPNNFSRIFTDVVSSNNIVVTNVIVSPWSGVWNMVDEVKLTTAKATVGGFTNGQIFFGNNSAAKVGLLSADGTVSNVDFAVLTNDTQIHGALYVDQTGTFGNNLIAVTGNGAGQGGGVWQINASGMSTRLVNLANNHLEGVITLTNDVGQWGPWAGKIITGNENTHAIFTISTNGIVTTNTSLGIDPEDFDLIPANQDLYCVNYHTVGDNPITSSILKVPKIVFADYVGDLLIAQAGETAPSLTPKLFIVRWDSTNSTFVTRKTISLPTVFGGHFEHVTFAPIDLPPVTR